MAAAVATTAVASSGLARAAGVGKREGGEEKEGSRRPARPYAGALGGGGAGPLTRWLAGWLAGARGPGARAPLPPLTPASLA